ncbi:MAG TPA: 3-ketoacyl-ACP reductase [Beijerinckiaceae bacterium]|jgi:NAD(P)-dependent dehydrogenase (short-subunit alcohol dehydrogenase family)|nr:3-ketoacyl-ACP reductase [Microvirga sp.]HZB38181.1 3-ketoacyl-ACP reductase [Beijerinckiaceae bacterium]
MRRAPVAAVTGGRQGIGRGIAFALAEAGFDVVVLDLVEDASAAETLAGICERGRKAAFVSGDIAEIERREEIADAFFAAFGTLDCLVNNAGVSVRVRGDLLEVTPESFDRVIGINLRGTFFLTQAVAKRMVADPRAPADPPRSIVTISSANTYLVGPDRAEYCFSKIALSMMTKAFALRLGEHGIRTYEIRPGIIRTAMTVVAAAKYDRLIAEGITPEARWGEPEDVGRAVATLAQGLVPFSTGDAFHIDGGLHIPKL